MFYKKKKKKQKKSNPLLQFHLKKPKNKNQKSANAYLLTTTETLSTTKAEISLALDTERAIFLFQREMNATAEYDFSEDYCR